MNSRACLAVCAVLACAHPAFANDSTGHLSAGGIVLGRSADIEMRSEDLYVSTAEVRVRYRFFNGSDKDITTLVAFPMPDVAAMGHAAGGNDGYATSSHRSECESRGRSAARVGGYRS